MYKKILVTGQMRSGTTFLGNFLNSQNNITLYSDIFHVVAGKILANQVKTMEIPYNKKLNKNEKETYLVLVQRGLDMLGDKTDYVLNIQIDDFDTPKELYYLLLDSIKKDEDRIVGHKVTETETNAKNLLLNTELDLIYIVRDPRDQVLSSMKKFGYDLNTAIAKWRNGIENILEINSKRLYIIKFEDLIYKSENLKNELEDFLNIELNYNIQKVKQHNKDFISNSSFNDVKKVFDENAVLRWKNKDEFIIKYIYLMTSDLIDSLNYQYIDCTNDDIERKKKIHYLFERNYELRKEFRNNKSKINELLNTKLGNYKIK